MVTATDTNSEEAQEWEGQSQVQIDDAGEIAEAPGEGAEETTQDVPAEGGEPGLQAEPQNAVIDASEPATGGGEEFPDLDPVPAQQAGSQEQEIAELQRLRQVNAQKQWEAQQLRQAQAIEKRAQEQGADPYSARQIAKQHLSHQKEIRDQENKSLDLIGFVEGRNNAAMHYAQKYKLVGRQALEDIKTLIKSRTPREMDVEAKRMAQFRSQTAEIQRLKQGSVKPQTFDNSQGSAEVTSNQDRLYEAYMNGDQSEAAVKAARKLTLGS